MAIETTLTSVILNPWATSSTPYTSGDQLVISYADLGYIASASDSYKSTAGDVFKVYVDGVRIYRTSDSIYAGGKNFLEDGDVDNSKLAGISATWASTSDTVWTIDTANQKVTLDTGEITGSTLYGSSGKNVSFTSGETIIELRRSVQDQSAPSIDFSNASILTEQDLDNSSANVFHMAQQAIEKANNALPYDVGTGVYQAYQPGTTTNKKITQVADGTATNDAVNYGQFTVHDATISGWKEDTEDYKLETADWAQKVDGAVKVYADNSVTGGALGYSAKAWTIGGTDITDTAGAGSAKQWAIGGGSSFTVGNKVDGSSGSYSAKYYSNAAATSATAASASETAAAASEASANASANAVASVIDNFYDKYLGVMADSVAFTANASTDVITATAHGLSDGDPIRLTTTGTLPAGLAASTDYYVRDKATNTFKLAASSGGTAIDITDTGSGSHYWEYADVETPATSSWAKNGSVITVASNTGIRKGQVVSGSGIDATIKPNVLSISGTSITISDNMDAVGANVAVTFANKGVYGAFNTTKDGPSTDNDGEALADGMLYFNSTDDVMMVYDTTSNTWKQLQPTTAEMTAIQTCHTNIISINDFTDKYRIASSAPSSDNDDGDLYYNTATNQLNVHDGSSWSAIGLTQAQTQTEANNAAVAMSIALG